MMLKTLPETSPRARSRTVSAERRLRQQPRYATAETPDGSVQVQVQVSSNELQGTLPTKRSLTSLADSTAAGGAWQLARARRQANEDGSTSRRSTFNQVPPTQQMLIADEDVPKDLVPRRASANQTPPTQQMLMPMEPKPKEVIFEDPRKRNQKLGIIGFNFHGKAEEWDNLCGSAFLGNFWELGMDGIQLEATSPFKQTSETKAFMNAEAAFQVLQF